MIQAVIYKTMSWYQGYGHYGYGHSFVSFSCFLMRKRWAAGHGKVIFEYPIRMVTANVGQWYAGYMEEVLRYVYNKSWTFGHLLWTEAIYVKPHGGVEDLWPRALTRLRSHGLERTGSINSVLSWIFELCQTKKASPMLGSQAPDSREVRGTPFFFFQVGCFEARLQLPRRRLLNVSNDRWRVKKRPIAEANSVISAFSMGLLSSFQALFFNYQVTVLSSMNQIDWHGRRCLSTACG